MTTTFFLVRHAAHDNVGGFLAGRTAGVCLGAAGRAQALRLAERMRREQFFAICSSPRERARETAEAIASVSDVQVETDDDLDEIDFGGWSGKTFAELNDLPDWRLWNADRARAMTPSGETMRDVQARIHSCMNRLASSHEGHAVVLVSHADLIKAAVCHVLQLPADACARFDINPASVTAVVSGDWGARVLWLNETVH